MVTIIAHRGHGPTSLLSGNGNKVPDDLAPENTLKAFREAVRQGADGIEFDVYATKEGGIAVIHDDELNKNVEGASRAGFELGRVSAKTMAELAEYNVGQGERIPSLRETLDFFVDANAERARDGKPPLIVNIELKGDRTTEIVAALAEEYMQNGKLRMEDFVFCSFQHKDLADLKKINPAFRVSPSLRTAQLFGEGNLVMPGWNTKEGAVYDPRGLEALRQFHRDTGCCAFDPVLWDVYRPLVDMAKEEGLELHVSTSDLRTFERKHIVVLLAIERAGIPVYFKTDEPAQARAVISELRATYEAALANPVQQVLHVETLREPPSSLRPSASVVPPSAYPLLELMKEAGLESVLRRPIGTRPSPYSSAYPGMSP